jgi:hypothetical protein
MNKWGPRVLLAIGVALAAVGLLRGQPQPGHYALTGADWAFVTAGIVVGTAALLWMWLAHLRETDPAA